jgi:hypothetical protein
MAKREYNIKHWYGFNVRMTDYATIKKQHDETIPIRGARKVWGIEVRPLSVRRRTWESWYEKDGWVGMAFRRSYAQRTHNAKTNKYETTGFSDEVKPLLMINEHGALRYTPAWMGSFATWEMLSALLPEGIKFVKYGAKQYFKVSRPDGEPMYYFIDGLEMTFIPYEKDGVKYYEPTHGVVRERKFLVDREKVKKAKVEWQAFLDYYQPMADMIGYDPKGNHTWCDKHDGARFLEETDWLFRAEGEEYGEKWVDAITAFHKAYTDSHGKYVTESTLPNGAKVGAWVYTYTEPTAERLRAKMTGELFYRMVRPWRQVDMPLGVAFADNYRR